MKSAENKQYGSVINILFLIHCVTIMLQTKVRIKIDVFVNFVALSDYKQNNQNINQQNKTIDPTEQQKEQQNREG